MPTPFKDGEVDTAAIQGNVRRWIAAGLGGVVALGTNGEASLLDDDEADRGRRRARQEVPAIGR
jgi:dihydrodipicolinate synthase/N-acetylneuraminate lyase